MVLLKCISGELAPQVVLGTIGVSCLPVNNATVIGSQCPVLLCPEFGISRYHARPLRVFQGTSQMSACFSNVLLSNSQ